MSVMLTPLALADRWHIDVKTLSNWRIAGKGPSFVKVGVGRNGKVLYRLDDIEAWEKKRIMKGTTV